MTSTQAKKPRKAKKLVSIVPLPKGPRMPWYPLDDELAPDYYAFKLYLDMGPGRSVKAVADTLSVGVAGLRTISSINLWENRAVAYDSHIIELEFQARDAQVATEGANWELRRSQIREEAFEVGTLLIQKAKAMLDFPLETEEESEIETLADGKTTIIRTVVKSPAKWAMRDAAVLLTAADQVRRLAAEMSTSNAKLTVETKRVELTVKMIVGLLHKGNTVEEVKQKLLGVGVAEESFNEAIKKVPLELQPKEGPQTLADVVMAPEKAATVTEDVVDAEFVPEVDEDTAQ